MSKGLVGRSGLKQLATDLSRATWHVRLGPSHRGEVLVAMTFERGMEWHLSLLKGISAAFLLVVAVGGGRLAR